MTAPFFTSLQTGLRLSVPKYAGSSPDALYRAGGFFVFAGWLVASTGVAGYWLGTMLFPPPALPVLLSLLATMWVTGACPEAGLANVFDGFDGEKTDRPVGRDGRLNARGMIALGLLLAVKFYVVQALFSVEPLGWPVALKYASAHSLSRLTAVTVLPSLPYLSDETDVKNGARRIGPGQWLGAVLLGLAPLLALVALTGLWIYLTFLIPLALLRWRIVRLVSNHACSDAGDWLGAAQQLAEVISYLSFVSLLWVSI